jgi:hypothetical protein
MHQHTSRFLVQGFHPTSTPLKLWLLGLIGLGAICSLLFPSNTLAVPTAEWTTPWIFALGPSTATPPGNASNAEDFGNIGSSGEALPGTGADAKSMSSVSTSIFHAMASTSVSFNRSFSLNGSPGGWDLSFNGALTGELSVTGQPMSPEASAIANAGISGAGPLFSPSINILQERLQPSLNSLGSAPVSNHFSATGVVGDGTYDVSGSLMTSAFADPFHPFTTTASAAANFFNSFTVSVNAAPKTPGPVPETINLIGAFAIVGFCGYIWFRRSRALRCS